MTAWRRREVIGDAVLYLGDCLAVVPELETVDAVFTDPPYSSGGTFRGDRMGRTSDKYQSTQHRGSFAEFSGDTRDQRAFGYWSALWLGACREKAREGSIVAVFTDWRQLPTTTDVVQAGGWIWRGIVVWDKTEGARPQRGRYRNQGEYVVWGSQGGMSEDGPCAPGVFRHSVSGRADKHHIAGKPVQLMSDLLQLVPAGGVVLDPFMGSGTTGLAALRNGCRFVGIEIDAVHFEKTCARLREAARQPTLLAAAAESAREELL